MTTTPSDDIEGIVCRVLAYAANISREDITRGARLVDFGIDSVGIAGICVVIEAELGVTISTEEVTQRWSQGTVNDLISLVDTHRVRCN